MVPTAEQVRKALEDGLDYEAAARRLGIPAGQAYMIATGVPADGSDTIPDQAAKRGGLLASSQHLANPPHENPTGRDSVREWMAARAAADEQMRAAARQRTPEPPPPADPESRQEVTVVLTRQHNQVRRLLKELRALPGYRTGGSPQDLATRKSIVEMIAARLSPHEEAEERHFWPAVRAAVPDGGQWAAGALQQEKQGKETLAALARLDPATDGFDEHAERLVAQLRKHVAYEERVFRLLREVMPAGEREQLGRRLQSDTEGEPATRPAGGM
jgi:hypothetical protein